MAVSALQVFGGVVVVLIIIADVVGALVLTHGRPAWWRPSRVFHARSWRGLRWLALRLPDGLARERLLRAYAPAALLLLLLIWLSGLLLGWSLIYLGLSQGVPGAHDYASIVYFSGSSLLTVGLGGIAPQSTLVRMLALVEALCGVGTLALLIAYLPGLYRAYHQRETRLLTLDDPSGRRLTPVTVLTGNAPDGDLGRLGDFFAGWDMWTAELLEHHLAHPSLCFLRSRYSTQAWLTALGVVMDAATLASAVIPGAEEREPDLMYRRGRRALDEIATRLRVAPMLEGDPVDRERLRIAYSRLVASSVPVRDYEDAWRRLHAKRIEYLPQLDALLEFLLMPRDFWGQVAETAEPRVEAAR